MTARCVLEIVHGVGFRYSRVRLFQALARIGDAEASLAEVVEKAEVRRTKKPNQRDRQG